MTDSSQTKLLAVGRLLGGHGVRGHAKIRPFNPGSIALASSREIWLRRGEAEPVPFEVREARRHGAVFRMALRGIENLDDLQPWRGSEVLVHPSSLPAASAGEVYHFEVVGLTVRTVGGDDVGVIREVMPLPGNDVWVVEAPGERGLREILIPVVGEIVKEIDLALGVASIDPPRGLLED